MRALGRNVSANNDITVITGLPRSGKSTLLKNKIIPEYLKKGKVVLAVDINHEYTPAHNFYLFDIDDYANAENEIEELLGEIIKGDMNVDCIVFDESNVIFNKTYLQPNARRLVNTLRHLKIDIIAVARRPVDINITISELATRRYVFHASGVNDIKRLNELKAGLGDRAQALGEHDYIFVDNDRREVLHKAKQG